MSTIAVQQESCFAVQPKLVIYGILGLLIILFIICVMSQVTTIPKTIAVPRPVAIPIPKVGTKRFEILYRGIPDHHTMSKYCKDGIAKPFGGKATPLQHRDGDTRSNYTSWTRDYKIAYKYATFDEIGNRCDGWILIRVFFSESKDFIDMKGQDEFCEDEVLIRSLVEGCIPIRVTADMSIKDFKDSFKFQ